MSEGNGNNKKMNQKLLCWGFGLFVLVSVVVVTVSNPGYLTGHIHAIAYIFGMGN